MSIESRMAHAVMAAAIGASVFGLTACTRGNDVDTSMSDGANSGQAREVVTVGFVGVGPEGPWRAANEASIQNAFTMEAGFELKYAPSTNLDQKSQIESFTTFVSGGVDVILLSTAEPSGLEDALGLAQQARIPVILIDGGIDPDHTSLYVTRIAPDNAAIAAAVADWAVTAIPEVANWSADEARSVTAEVLEANDNVVPLIVAQNDEMGLGAAQAVEAAGLTPGVDVKIATIGGNKGALQALLGGGTVESSVVVPSKAFGSITQEELDARQY